MRLLLFDARLLLLGKLQIVHRVVRIRIQMKGFVERFDCFGVLLAGEESHALIEELLCHLDLLLLRLVHPPQLGELRHQAQDVGGFRSELGELLEFREGVLDITVTQQFIALRAQGALFGHFRFGNCINDWYSWLFAADAGDGDHQGQYRDADDREKNRRRDDRPPERKSANAIERPPHHLRRTRPRQRN